MTVIMSALFGKKLKKSEIKKKTTTMKETQRRSNTVGKVQGNIGL